MQANENALYEAIRRFVSSYLAVVDSVTSPLPSDAAVSVVVPNGTPPGVVFELELYPPSDDYVIAPRVIKVGPDAELLINVRARGVTIGRRGSSPTT